MCWFHEKLLKNNYDPSVYVKDKLYYEIIVTGSVSGAAVMWNQKI